MPHVIEPAASGRAKCRACKGSLPKGELRFGEEVDNPFGDGTATHWYHLRCAALRRPVAFLNGLESSAEVDGLTAAVEPLRDLARVGTEFERLTRFVGVQLAPSGRARCQGCRELIDKGALRFVLERVDDGVTASAGFVHVDCAHAYAGAVDSLLDRIGSPGELEPGHWTEIEAAISRQSRLPRAEEKKAPETSN